MTKNGFKEMAITATWGLLLIGIMTGLLYLTLELMAGMPI